MRKLSSLTLTAGILAASISAASAADMPVAPPPPPVYDWSGWQYGVGFGVNRFDSIFDSVGLVPATTTAHTWDQVRISLHGSNLYMVRGFGWGGFVFGLDYAASFPLDNVAGVSACPNPLFGCETRVGALYTAGGKIGLGFDRLLIYGTGGFALGQVKTRFIPPPGGASAPDEIWQSGFYFGAGIDVMVWKGTGVDMLLGVEYQHVDLGTDRHGLAVGVVVPGNTRDVTVTSDSFKAKATFKFDGPRFW